MEVLVLKCVPVGGESEQYEIWNMLMDTRTL